MGFEACLRSLVVPLVADGVRSAGSECVLVPSRWESGRATVGLGLGVWACLHTSKVRLSAERLHGKGGGLSGDSGRRFRVRCCARKLVSGPRGQGQVGVCACWVGTVGQRRGLSGDSGRRVRVLLGA